MLFPSKQWQRKAIVSASVVLGVVSGFMAFDYALGTRTLTLDRPNFQLAAPYDPSKPTIIVFDGFIGHPQLRLQGVMSAYKKYNVLFANPQGQRFDAETTARDALAELKKRGISRLVVQGASMGAKIAYRLLLLIEGDASYNPTIEGFLLLDPLYSGEGVKLDLAKKIHLVTSTTGWRPGPMTNWLLSRGDFLGEQLVQDVGDRPNAHQLYGRQQVSARRVWDEAFESASPAITGRLKSPPIVWIIYVDPEDDEVLKSPGEVVAWLKIFPHAVTHMIPAGRSHHVGVDSESEEWEPFIEEALAS